jgi:hypothetical protein
MMIARLITTRAELISWKMPCAVTDGKPLVLSSARFAFLGFVIQAARRILNQHKNYL